MARTRTKGKTDGIKSNRRGFHAKSKTHFKKGADHISHSHSKSDIQHNSVSDNRSTAPKPGTSRDDRPTVRHSAEHLKEVAVPSPNDELHLPAADGTCGRARVLRAGRRPSVQQPRQRRRRYKQRSGKQTQPAKKKSTTTGQYNLEKGNILVEKSMLLDLVNTFTKTHQADGTCNNLDLDMIDFRPWGLFSSVILTCKSCGKKSPRKKLYEEIPTTLPGRRQAAGNMRLALISQDMPVGPTEIQLLFGAVGLRAGSQTGMQKNAYKASDITEGVARRDMEKWIEYAKEVLRDRGVENPNHISAQTDVVYHGVTRSNAQGLGQGAARATGITIETATRSQKIVAADHINTTCIAGSRRKGRGKLVVCGEPGSKEDHGCTATQATGKGISEYESAARNAETLDQYGVTVTHLCTDSDSRARDGFADFNKKKYPSLPPLTWYKDPSHLSRNMKNKINKHTFSRESFGLKSNGEYWNSKERPECRKALALDVPRRVSITLRNMRHHYKGKTNDMKKNVHKIVRYMLTCYNGDHSSCSHSVLARLTGCTGSSGGRCWFRRSITLRPQRISSLNLSGEDETFLLSVIQMKLSTQALDYLSRGMTTSKCEYTNRAVNRSLPKNKPFPRISKGRVYSAIGRINNTFLQFTAMKFIAAKCPLDEKVGLAYQVLSKYQHRRDIIAQRQKTKEAKKRKQALVAHKTAEYIQQRRKIVNEDEYHKFQLDTALQASASAMDAVLSSVPSTSDAYVQSLQDACSLALNRQNTLEQALEYEEKLAIEEKQAQDNRRKSQRLRRAAAKKRVQYKTDARAEGTKESVLLRMEHSYGKL